jgi:hypothetical protein
VNDITKQLAEALRDLLNAADCYGMPFNDPARKAAREALRLYEQAKPAEPVTDKQLLAEAEFAESYDASAPSFMSLLRDDAVVGDFQRRLLICMRAAVKLAAPVAQAVTAEQTLRDALIAMGSTQAQTLSAGDLLDVVCQVDAAQRPAVAQAEPRKPLTDEQIEGGRSKLFSVSNPYCPITEKAMRTAVRWTERCHGIKENQP